MTSYALVAVFVSEDCGRDVFFAPQSRLEETHLLGILLDEDECSLVKEQVCNVLINLTHSLIDDDTKLPVGVRISYCILHFI